ncbi:MULTISPECIES: heme/hemin ABC transporter substrate-binding protein [Sphingobacterium]|uniref:heme/hemin ABC transporter substrate-binding protein n=1 Tax=Sphingobacterium TaxID=28453 RepID=UPI0006281411|nr:ABC transporter substrate-binding protein [Sphingobacterium sp. Ag1]KKO89111.1 hemin ABC transporter substrate-binding protein [Sphingobacterium sp. Ag1]
MSRFYVIILCFLMQIGGWARAQQRIITLNSSLTETIYGLGIGERMVATDVTSISPKAAAALPRVSKNRSISAEGLLSFKPSIVIANEGDVSKAVIHQIRAAGVKFVSIKPSYSVSGALRYIQEVADAVGESAAGKSLVSRTKLSLDHTIELVKKENQGKAAPKVLFLYARGTGTMSVAGKGSSLDAMINLAGGKNAVQEFSDFKPYTTEALVQANPDIVLLFDFGASSLGGQDAILKLPGMRITNAGKNERILVMNASLLVNFSNRLPDAILALHRGFGKVMDSK